MGTSSVKLSQIAPFLGPEHSLRKHAIRFSLECPRHSPRLWKDKLVSKMGRHSEVTQRQAQCSQGPPPRTGPTRLHGGTGRVFRWLLWTGN